MDSDFQTIQTPDQIRFVLPTRLDYTIRDPRVGGRIGAWFALVGGLGAAAGTGWCAYVLMSGAHRTLPSLGETNGTMLLTLAVEACAVLLMALPFWLSLFLVVAAAWPMQVEFGINARSLTRSTRRGPFRSSRSWRISRIQGFLIHRPLAGRAKRNTFLTMQTGSEVVGLIAGYCTHVTRNLAIAFQEQLRRRQADTAGDVSSIPVVDISDLLPTAPLTIGIEHPPAGTKVATRHALDALEITLPPRCERWRDFLEYPIFRIGVGVIMAAILTVALIAWVRHILGPDALRGHVVFVQCAVGGYLGLVGIPTLLLAATGMRQRAMIVATRDHLSVSEFSPLRTHKRSWPRSDIAAIRVRRRVPENERRSFAIEVVLRDGRVQSIHYAHVGDLLYIATMLRRALGIPAEIPPQADGPSWRTSNVTTPPQGSRAAVFPAGPDWEIRLLSQGVTRRRKGRVALTCIALLAAFIGGIALASHCAGIQPGSIALAAAWVLLISFFVGLLYFAQLTYSVGFTI